MSLMVSSSQTTKIYVECLKELADVKEDQLVTYEEYIILWKDLCNFRTAVCHNAKESGIPY